jgi:hypothetical protein
MGQRDTLLAGPSQPKALAKNKEDDLKKQQEQQP